VTMPLDQSSPCDGLTPARSDRFAPHFWPLAVGNARAFRIDGSFCHKNEVDISVVLRMWLVSGVEQKEDNDEDERNTCSCDFRCAWGNCDCCLASISRQPLSGVAKCR